MEATNWYMLGCLSLPGNVKLKSVLLLDEEKPILRLVCDCNMKQQYCPLGLDEPSGPLAVCVGVLHAAELWWGLASICLLGLVFR